MTPSERPLTVVTGASTGIGRGLARALAEEGHDLVIAADEPRIEEAATELRAAGVEVRAVVADLSTREGVLDLADAAESLARPIEGLVLNAGIGVEGRFWETDVEDHLRLIGLNVAGAVHLAGLFLPAMVARGSGRVLVTSSIADAMAGPRMSTYNASKTFLTAWAEAVRQELDGTGVTLTTLKPGGTDTAFFERADMPDSKLAQSDNDDPDEVGREGVAAMLAGEAEVVSGPMSNKLMRAAAGALPDRLVGKAHERFVEDEG